MRTLAGMLVVGVTLALAGAQSAAGGHVTRVTPATEAPSEARALSRAFAGVAHAIGPSVVRIEVQTARERGTASGIIIDTRGYVVTSNHVLDGAPAIDVDIIFPDGRHVSADVVGRDAPSDVAVVRMRRPPADLSAARFGDSDGAQIGEWVLAVGSPLGLDQTVTAGIVSGMGKVGRHVQMSGGRVRQYIQTDAKINPGNSGGPLVNLSAEVVGINTLINTGPGGAYGFAIPINQVRMVAGSLLKEGRVRYAYLGVLVGDIEQLDPNKKAQLPGVDHGVFVSQVTPGGPAGKAGMRAGDVITEIDGRKMEAARADT